LLKALDRALVRLQLDPAEVVIVTDIGCIGLSCRYFETGAFHGLHGRSLTYATGLKLARPGLTVVTLMGDGGCGIGGTHLLNAARRNVGVTLIVANNFNYGMTGGQHSVTTPSGGVTSSTPWGNVEAPMDLCATVAGAGGAWIYRATVFDGDLPEVIGEAIAQPGFSMIDVWELCSAYYVPRNRLGKKELLALLDELGFGRGLIAYRPRPEYGALYRERYLRGERKPETPALVEPRFDHAVTGQTGIAIAGGAGQKVKSAATLFGQAAMFAGLDATQKDDYPITVQTGYSVSEVIVSPDEIEYTGIDAPDYFLLLSPEGVDRTRTRIERLPAGCTVYTDPALELPPTAATVKPLPARKKGKAGDRAAPIAALAMLLRDTGLFPVDALVHAVRSFQQPDFAMENLKALGVE
jgi:Pyruvate/2-oxoacid:ferredoxin oxidoreductase gamma subunit